MSNGFVIQIDVDQASANAVLSHLEMKLSQPGLHQFMRDQVSPYLRRRIADRFINQGDDITGPWHPLTVATQKIRAASGYPPSAPINVRSTQMMDFLVGSPSDITSRGDTAVLIHPPPTGNKLMLKKIATAQMGSAKPKTPPRPVLGMNVDDLDYITSELTEYLVRDLI